VSAPRLGFASASQPEDPFTPQSSPLCESQSGAAFSFMELRDGLGILWERVSVIGAVSRDEVELDYVLRTIKCLRRLDEANYHLNEYTRIGLCGKRVPR
jgi:hypothetical protein